jgi:hypothetical protein
MTWTYSGDPSASNRDAVRFSTGDTDTDNQIFSDEEIAYALAQSGDSVLDASILLVRAGLAKYARSVDKSVGDLSKSYSQITAHLRALLPDLEAQRRASGGLLRVYAGGMSKADKATQKADTDADVTPFHKDQFRNRGFP